MVDTQTKDYSLKYFKEGLIGHNINVLRTLQKRIMRKSMVEAVHDKNEIAKKTRVFFSFVRNHQITNVREYSGEILDLTHDGLQATIDALQEWGLNVQDYLETTTEFMKKHGTELSYEEIQHYDEYVAAIQGILDNYRKYLDELTAAIEGKELALGSLNIEYKKYNVSSFLHPVKNFFEWYAMRSTAKEFFKLESRIKKLEEGKKFSKSDAEHLIKFDKAYTKDAIKLLHNICVYKLIIIRKALEVGDELIDAASTKRYDLPGSYSQIGEEFVHLLNNDYDALKSLNKARLQLNSLANTARAQVEKTKDQIKRNELAMKRAS